MLEFSKRTNTLEQTEYEYILQDVPEPHLYRLLYNYDEVPKIPFNHRHVPMAAPDRLWLTDTTFRDGQQARPPYTVEQIVQLYELMHGWAAPTASSARASSSSTSKKDREAVDACRELGYEFPEITGWIRAIKSDFKLVKEMGSPRRASCVSCSDYHIFLKLNMTRRQAMDQYLDIVKAALDTASRPAATSRTSPAPISTALWCPSPTS